MVENYFKDIIEFLTTGMAPTHFTVTQEKKLVVKTTDYQLIVGKLYKLGLDEILGRCIIEHEKDQVLEDMHAGVVGGHYAGKTIAQKILRARIWWPTLHKDAKEYCQACNVCQRTGKTLR